MDCGLAASGESDSSGSEDMLSAQQSRWTPVQTTDGYEEGFSHGMMASASRQPGFLQPAGPSGGLVQSIGSQGRPPQPAGVIGNPGQFAIVAQQDQFEEESEEDETSASITGTETEHEGLMECFADIGDHLPDFKDPKCKCGTGCCCFLFLLLCLSIKGLAATEYALTRNAITSAIDYTTVYHGGRHFIGPFQGFIRFPATLQTIEWSHPDDAQEHLGTDSSADAAPLKVRTASGIMVELGMAVQYHIVEEHIGSMYRDFKDMVAQNFVSQLRAGFNDVIQYEPTENLWKERARVTARMLEACNTIAKNEMKNYVACWNLQLKDIWIPKNVEASMIQKQVQEQLAKREQQRQIATLVRADTNVIEAEFDRDIAVINATAAAKAFTLTQKAKSEAGNRWRSKRAEALQAARAKLVGTPGTPAGVLNGDQMLLYKERTMMIDSKKANLLYGDFNVVTEL